MSSFVGSCGCCIVVLARLFSRNCQKKPRNSDSHKTKSARNKETKTILTVLSIGTHVLNTKSNRANVCNAKHRWVMARDQHRLRMPICQDPTAICANLKATIITSNHRGPELDAIFAMFDQFTMNEQLTKQQPSSTQSLTTQFGQQ